MNNSNQISMSDFSVTFFIGRHMVTKTLSEVIENKENSLFLEELGLPGDIVLPFYQEKGVNSLVYSIKQNPDDRFSATLYNQPCDNHIVEDGDYIVFKDRLGNPVFRMLFIETSNLKAGYSKYLLKPNQNIMIGRSPANDISFDLNKLISREKHIAIHVDENGDAYVEDLKRSVGLYVNGKLTHSQKLEVLDEIYIMGLSMIYLGDVLAVRDYCTSSNLIPTNRLMVKQVGPKKKKEKNFVRSPRILRSLDNKVIEIDPPPKQVGMDQTPLLLQLGPSLTMALVMMASMSVSVYNALNGGNMATVISSGIMAVGMFIGAIVWPTLLRNYQKRRVLADNEYIKNRYQSYIYNVENELIDLTEKSVKLLNNTLEPAPNALCSFLDNDSSKLRLWERSYQDNDFLNVRVGTGERPFNTEIKIPRVGFQLTEDDLVKMPGVLSERYSTLKDVPVTLDIGNNQTIGIIGDDQNIKVILNEILLNIVSLHSYDEVKIVLITSPKDKENFKAFYNTPHAWSNDKKIRFLATTPEEVHFLFNAIDNSINERETQEEGDNKRQAIPHIVFVITSPNLIEKEALNRYMNDAHNNVGITSIFAYGDITQIPKSCETIIQSDQNRTGYYIKNQNENKFTKFELDKINSHRIENFTDKLNKLDIKREINTLGIPDSISFLQMYKVGNIQELNIEQNWESNNSARSLAAPIGVIAGGDNFNLDIHEEYHGCHGLVAGTTGAGKSEFLQAYILSLAINYSPKEVAFVLVDFKGGDMARPFMAKRNSPALPHLAATISNLSGSILYRAMVSFEAEIKYRQRLFNEAAAKLGIDKLDINSYHKYFKAGKLNEPLPHLIIIIDEFAQLKSQHPEFLSQLINVAQVGRSLGIHLILATQKPSGLVDPQIWSNSRFRICLRVADKQDSMDMINKPDSALIKNPGRLYVQVGYDEIYECVQSGYSGAVYEPTDKFRSEDDITVNLTDNTANPMFSAKLNYSYAKTDKSQLEAAVSEIVDIGRKKNLAVRSLWLDVMPERIYLNTLPKSAKGLATTTLGLVDLVRTQQQIPLTIDLDETGHIGLYGASGTGKTTFIQTMIYSMIKDYRYTPEELNIYALDFGGRNLGYLNELPHTGGVIYTEEEEKLTHLIMQLEDIINERKILFSQNNVGTFHDFRSISNQVIPAIIVVIDNFSSLYEKYYDLADRLIDIISSGKTYGIFFVITGSTKNAINYRVTEHISKYFTLKMNDPSNYFEILNIRPPLYPEDYNGRGLTVMDKEIVEFQTALPFKSENEAERIAGIVEEYQQVAHNWNGPRAISIENGPEEKTQPSAPEVTPTVSKPVSRPKIRSSVKTNAKPVAPLTKTEGSLVIGTSPSGALQFGLDLDEDYRLAVVTDGRYSYTQVLNALLSQIQQDTDSEYVFIDSPEQTFKSVVNNYPGGQYISTPEELDRFIEMLKPELNNRLEKQPDVVSKKRFILIHDFNEFFETITDEQAAFLRKVLKYINAPDYGITFITGFNSNSEKNNDSLFMSLLVRAENYIFGPNSYIKASQKIESLPNIPNLKANSFYLTKDDASAEVVI